MRRERLGNGKEVGRWRRRRRGGDFEKRIKNSALFLHHRSTGRSLGGGHSARPTHAQTIKTREGTELRQGERRIAFLELKPSISAIPPDFLTL